MATVACLSAQPPFVAVGYDSGAVELEIFGDGEASATKLPEHHRGGVLCCAFSSGEPSYLLTGGADGCVRLVSCACGPNFARIHAGVSLEAREGAIAGAHGLLVESIAANAACWAAPVGKCVAVGGLPQSDEEAAFPGVQYLGPLLHVVDAVQLCPHVGSLGDRDGGHAAAVAAASFGGVSLWSSQSAEGNELTFERLSAALPASRGGTAADLACDGWARSLVASPDGAWLASWVVLAGETPTKLWLWRVGDGADFECSGFAPSAITSLAWRDDSHALASCCGGVALVWAFSASPRPLAGGAGGGGGGGVLRGGPAGRPPARCVGADGTRLISAAFSPGGTTLACGASDGSVHLFDFDEPRAAAPVSMLTASAPRVEQHAALRWGCAPARGAHVEHLLWAGERVLVAAGYTSEGIAAWDVGRAREGRDDFAEPARGSTTAGSTSTANARAPGKRPRDG